MTSPNFGSILDRPPSKDDRPKALPAGSYVCVVDGRPRYDVSSKKKTEFVEFSLKPISAGEDVDSDDLLAALTRADGTSSALSDKRIKATYYLTEDAIWRLNTFLEHLGIEEEEGKSRRVMIDETPGKQVIAFIKHEASDDGATVFAKLASTAPVE